MEKKHRNIVVDDVQYAWTIYGGGKEQHVQVWKDKKEYFSQNFRLTSVTPADVADAIKEYNEAIRKFELGETLDKEWTAFLDTIPWQGYGSIEASNQRFISQRKNWMKKMIKKYGVTMDDLNKRFNHDTTN